MARFKSRVAALNKPRNNRYADLMKVPRWRTILAGFILMLGFMVFLAVLWDASEAGRGPGFGAGIYVASVLWLAAFLVYDDWNRRKGHRR
jgi:hypothetical protein